MITQTKINKQELLQNFTDLELAQALADKLAISSNDWHKLKANRQAQAKQQLALALVFLVKNEQKEALMRLQQATGWLDKTINPLPCPSHGDK